MRRRKFILTAASALATSPLMALAHQGPRRDFKVGYLAVGSREQQLHLIKALEDALRQLGYRSGENLSIEFRFAEGNLERLDNHAAELVSENVDAFVVSNNANIAAALRATRTIPIVTAASVDPVGAGLVSSLNRPGGNVTGFTQDTGPEIYGKRVELLKDALPDLSRVGVLWNPDFPPNAGRLALTEQAAETLGLTVVRAESRGIDALERAFSTLAQERVQALVVLAEPVMFNVRNQIAELARRERLAGVSSGRDFAAAGLLLAYGVDFKDLFRSIAHVVDKILKGTKPGDLPIEQPTQFELVINLKAAKALSLTLPPALMARADEVIE